MSIRRVLLGTTMLVGIVGGVHLTVKTAQAADLTLPFYKPPLPQAAVDGFNSKWEALGGTLDHKPLYGHRGGFSMPLAGQWGLQIDTSVGSLDRRAFGGIGGHLFSRDPSQGLAGLYVNHIHWDQFGGVHATHVALEGARYFGRWTLEGIAGVEFGNSVQNVTTSNFVVPPGLDFPGGVGAAGVSTLGTFIEGYNIKTRFFDQVNLKYYFTDNWDGYIGHRYLGGKNAFAVGSEAAVSLGRGAMATAFVEARFGENAYNGVWGGLKFYFGRKDKTLIQRHRQDDPPFWDNLFTITNNHFTSGSSSSSLFCGVDNNGDPTTLQPNGTCLEAGAE